MLLDFYFDFISPYSYLAVKRLPHIPELADIDTNWLPFNLPKVIKDSGNTPPASSRAKALYMMQDLKRWARLLDVPFKLIKPGAFDARPGMALACMLEGDERLRFCTAAFDAIWSGAVNPVSDSGWVERIIETQSLPAAWLTLDLEEGKERIKTNTEAALKAGCFGAPTFILKGQGRPQMFWGVDRMDFLATAVRALKAADPGKEEA